MAKMRQILIIGNNDNGCTPEIEKIAYDAGKHVAESNSVLITGDGNETYNAPGIITPNIASAKIEMSEIFNIS